jgi:hypothetical protein
MNMQLETVRRDVSSSGTMQVAKATIKVTPKIFDMFANDTYANKPLAIMRELVANGIDAHVACGQTRPVEVVLPTPFDPTCRIRDFGTGMAHDFVMGPFMAYTDGSTKDKSDDAIGGFGIGSKSPFAYVDQYTLRVVHEGVLSVYTMFKDEDGIPAVGLQAQTTTDEANGVEVAFPVEDADMDTFATAAQDALQFFLPLPIVTNGTLNGPDYTYVGKGWAMRPKAGELGVIMGGVRYPAAKASMAYDVRQDPRVGPLLDYGLDLTMPIGSCGVAMSREALSYTPKTSASIKAALEAVIDDVVATFANFFDNCATEWDAMKLLQKETAIGQGQYSRSGRAQLLLSNAKYKGQPLETGFRIGPETFRAHGVFADDCKGWMLEPARSRRSTTCPAPKWVALPELFTIEPGSIETVIIDDLPQSPKSKTVQRIREFIDSQPQVQRTLTLRGKDEHQVKMLLRMFREPTNFVLTSTMPEPAAKAKGVKNARPKVRMFTFNGQNDRFTHSTIRNLTPSTSKRDAVKEIPYPDQPATGTMVVMNSFDLPSDFYDKMKTTLVRYDELVFVNVADEPKLKATFRQFNDVFAERLAKALAAYPELPQRLALAADSDMQSYVDYFDEIVGDRRYNDLPAAAQQRPFGRLFAAWKQYVQPLTNQQRLLSPFVKAELPVGINPKVLVAGILKQKEVCILLRRLRLGNADERALFFKHL